ncbi:pantoate--beta-alanine ligase [Streptomyces decoyicus]|uniref:pantoate--beta-alanine ligase n=1 Tax=Streptomyces decoyicus TaxID=249567 RepID=UPI002E31C5D7|nr:pantoate--beta-alanine ligase [Streptomyces decoyicus]
MTSSPLSPHPDQPADASRPTPPVDAGHQARTADASHPAPSADASHAAHSAHSAHLVHTAAALRDLPRSTGARAVVMTMGALHEGHATLVRAARHRVGPKGQVVVTVFVNPLQFGAGEDLDRYPRTLDADVELAAAAGADVVFAPSVDEVYPGGEPQIRIAAGPMGTLLEGASRPGHFDGVLTVVAKLLHLTAPDLAFYGQKDAQQLAVITRMAADLNFPVEIVGVPTVREEDGLALSSRNRYLSGPERCTALALSAALFAARDRLAAEEALRVRAASVGHHPAPDRAAALAALGEDRAAADAHAVAYAAAGVLHGPAVARAAARAVLDDAARLDPPLTLDYLALVDPSDFTEVPDAYEGEAILAVAAKVGSTRLIDNIRLVFGVGRPEATAAQQGGTTTEAADTGDAVDVVDAATSATAAPSASPPPPSVTSTPPATPPTTPQGPLGAPR